METVAETTANVSLGDLSDDANLDSVLAKGRHWPLRSVVLFGDGKGHFVAPQPLPAPASRTYSAPLADLNGDGKLDMVLSNDRPDPKYVLLNDGTGHFKLAGTFGDPNWATRNVVLADLNGDGSPDIAEANRPGPSYACFNDGRTNFTCRQLGPESSATILAGDMNRDGAAVSWLHAATRARVLCTSTTGMATSREKSRSDRHGHRPARSRLGILMATDAWISPLTTKNRVSLCI